MCYSIQPQLAKTFMFGIRIQESIDIKLDGYLSIHLIIIPLITIFKNIYILHIWILKHYAAIVPHVPYIHNIRIRNYGSNLFWDFPKSPKNEYSTKYEDKRKIEEKLAAS